MINHFHCGTLKAPLGAPALRPHQRGEMGCPSSLASPSCLVACQAALQTLAKCVFAQGLLEFLLLRVTQMAGIQHYRNSCSVAFITCPLINWCIQETCSPSYSKSGHATLIRGLFTVSTFTSTNYFSYLTWIILDRSEVSLHKEILFQASLFYEHKYRFKANLREFPKCRGMLEFLHPKMMSSYLKEQTALFSKAELVGVFTKTSSPTQTSEYQYSQIINLDLFLQDKIPPLLPTSAFVQCQWILLTTHHS